MFVNHSAVFFNRLEVITSFMGMILLCLCAEFVVDCERERERERERED